MTSLAVTVMERMTSLKLRDKFSLIERRCNSFLTFSKVSVSALKYFLALAQIKSFFILRYFLKFTINEKIPRAIIAIQILI